MAGSIIGTLVAGLFLFVLLRYGLERISNRRDLALAAAFAALMVLALLASGVGLLGHSAGLKALAEASPLSSQEDLLNWKGSSPTVVTATIAPDMPVALDDYVAYVEEEEGGYVWRPALELVLDDGARVWTSGDYEPVNWDYAFDISFLKAGDLVVAIGEPLRTANISGDNPAQGVELNVQVLYRGRYEDFRAGYLPGRRTEANISLVLAAVIGVSTVVFVGLAVVRFGLRWRNLNGRA